MKVTYYGHSCFAVELGGKHLLFDPFITPNPLASEVKVDTVQADFIFISHGHEDHIADAISIAQRTGALVVSNYEIVVWLGQQGISNGHPLNHGGGVDLAFGRAQFVNAVHSSMLPDGSYGGNPGGWVIQSAEGSFYHSGDTALTLDMKLIKDSISLQFAALCIGDNFTMGVQDAIRAADFVGCDQVLGMHYDTFPPIEIDQAAARKAFETAGKTLHLPPIGSRIEL